MSSPTPERRADPRYSGSEYGGKPGLVQSREDGHQPTPAEVRMMTMRANWHGDEDQGQVEPEVEDA